jgi:hypothetical protein
MGGYLKFVQRKPKAAGQVPPAVSRMIPQNASEKLPFFTAAN